MAFIIAAGFASSTTAVPSNTPAGARVQPAPQMRLTGMTPSHDRLLSRISSAICDNATRIHRVDFERLSCRAEAECQLQEIFADLKDRIVGKTVVRTRSKPAGGRVDRYEKVG